MDAPREMDDAEQLRMLVQKLARRIRLNRGDDSISDTQLVVLFHLKNNGTLAPVSLAALERVSPPSMNRTLNALERRGLVSRRRRNDDARKVDVTLTPAGADLVAETRRVRTQWFGERLAELSAAEREALTAAVPVLRRLVES